MGLTMKDKKALTQELAKRYRRSDRKQKTAILDEFIKTTGYRRKYAIHLLANWGKRKTRVIDRELVSVVVGRPKKQKRVGTVTYGESVRAAVTELWKFFDYMCGKRLVVLIRMNIELLMHQPELCIDGEVKKKLMSISAATIDRILKPEREKMSLRSRSPTRPGPILKHQIPIRTFYPWDEQITRILRVRHRRTRWGQRRGRMLLHAQRNRCVFGFGGAQSVEKPRPSMGHGAGNRHSLCAPFRTQRGGHRQRR